MTCDLSWLPPLLCLTEFGGDWERYEQALYARFRADFVDSAPTVFAPRRWAMKRHPLSRGKEATFWHLISSGDVEDDRLPSLRRCERIGWPRCMIDALGSPQIRSWRNQRGGEKRLVIAVEDFSYLTILSERKDYVLLWTAFDVEGDRRRERYAKEWEKLGE